MLNAFKFLISCSPTQVLYSVLENVSLYFKIQQVAASIIALMTDTASTSEPLVNSYQTS